MLPPEPRRSRAAELQAEVRIPNRGESQAKGAQAALEALLSARRIKKEKEANEQRSHRQHLKWERLCQAEGPQAEVAGPSFWTRHNFGRSSSRMCANGQHASGVHPKRVCKEVARRATAHTNDAIKAVLEEEDLKEDAERQRLSERPSDSSALGLANGTKQGTAEQTCFDWSDPFAMAYNNSNASKCRDEKWELHRQLDQGSASRPLISTFGFDDEDVKLLKESERLESLAGGGVSLAQHILSLQESGACARDFLPWAAQVKAAAFEMPKELALRLAIAFAEGSDESDDLLSTAMALMSSAATRARDSDGFSFPIEGLEALSKTGLSWRAFSNMFLAALFSHLQREACQKSLLERAPALPTALARRVAAVFLWARSNQDDIRLYLSPAGRRVVQATYEALDGQSDLETLSMLAALAVRDTNLEVRAR